MVSLPSLKERIKRRVREMTENENNDDQQEEEES